MVRILEYEQFVQDEGDPLSALGVRLTQAYRTVTGCAVRRKEEVALVIEVDGELLVCEERC